MFKRVPPIPHLSGDTVQDLRDDVDSLEEGMSWMDAFFQDSLQVYAMPLIVL